METIGASISRIRNITKTVKEDAFITDRFLYSLILKYANLYISRLSTFDQWSRFALLFRVIPCLELIEVDKIEACCGGISSGCTIMRTKEKIPSIVVAASGPIFGTVSSIDSSIEVFPTTPSTFTSMTKTSTFKYNTRKYYWFLNDYMYFPNIEWESIRMEAVFEGDLTMHSCATDDNCTVRQDHESPIPEELFAEIEKQVLNDLGITLKIPSDGTDDKQNLTR